MIADTQPATLAMAEAHGLNQEEFVAIEKLIGRLPNKVELALFSAMWSEHCSYKSTRIHLKKLPTQAPWVICGPGENAGIISIGDGDAIVFKMESHNHPSYIEPFQGAATGVGGILRDIFTMGARPIALLNALRFGEPSHPKTPHLLSGVVSGISFYGNCVGVPTVGGECSFHPCYNDNILVNAMCVGLVNDQRIFYSAASEVGASVLYVGSKTGRDGIHGASMSSAEFNEESEEKRPTVQVGDPFAEKLLIEACLELMAEDAILSIQDMGAAGLTSSSLEMASKGNTGIALELSHVPMREPGMTPYEIMLSESQERMLMVMKPGKEAVAERIFRKWQLDCAHIGRITDTKHVVLSMHGQVVADLPITVLTDAAPCYDRPSIPVQPMQAFNAKQLTISMPLADMFLTLLRSADLCSKRWIYEQYDNTVMGNTRFGSGGDAGVVRIGDSQKAIATASDCTPRYCRADARLGAIQAVAENYRNLSAVGATPLAITNCLNFGNPQKPEVMGQIIAAIEGIGEACRALDYPVVSGNVSLYNETSGKGIDPTPTIGGIGLIQDLRATCASHFQTAGETIFLLGNTPGHIGQTLFLREIGGKEEGTPPPVDLAAEKAHAAFVRSHIQQGTLSACHDLSDGGLGIALVEMMMPGAIGATITLPNNLPDWQFLFAEDQGRYLLATSQPDILAAAAQKAGISLCKLGTTTSDPTLSLADLRLPITTLRTTHEATLPQIAQK